MSKVSFIFMVIVLMDFFCYLYNFEAYIGSLSPMQNRKYIFTNLIFRYFLTLNNRNEKLRTVFTIFFMGAGRGVGAVRPPPIVVFCPLLYKFKDYPKLKIPDFHRFVANAPIRKEKLLFLAHRVADPVGVDPIRP